MHPLTERELEILQLAKVRNQQALKLLVHSYGEALYHHILKLVAGEADADDVLQETLIKAWQGLHGFRGDSSLGTWLHRIALREAYSFLRKEQLRRKRLQWIGLGTKGHHDTDFIRNPDFLLLQGLSILPERQRLVFVWRYFDQMEYQSMATLTGLSAGALKASYHHAYKKMEVWLKARA
jgi:RNA polymerase sigma-70 factor (ECF subfamily)